MPKTTITEKDFDLRADRVARSMATRATNATLLERDRLIVALSRETDLLPGSADNATVAFEKVVQSVSFALHVALPDITGALVLRHAARALLAQADAMIEGAHEVAAEMEHFGLSHDPTGGRRDIEPDLL